MGFRSRLDDVRAPVPAKKRETVSTLRFSTCRLAACSCASFDSVPAFDVVSKIYERFVRRLLMTRSALHQSDLLDLDLSDGYDFTSSAPVHTTDTP